jgi:hypothetical protein
LYGIFGDLKWRSFCCFFWLFFSFLLLENLWWLMLM